MDEMARIERRTGERPERTHWGGLCLSMPPERLAYVVPALAVEEDARFVAEFASERDGRFYLHAVVEIGGTYLILEAPLAGGRFSSLALELPAADWPEREMKDLFGLTPSGHPHPERLVLPEGWPEGEHPLRKSFAREKEVELAPPERERPIMRDPVEGDGVFHIPYGPIRSGVFESAQFVVDTPGEKILKLHLNMFYKHRGMEKIFEGVPLEQAPLVAERVSGTDSFAQSLAFCEAAERALGVEVPPRARHWRVILSELERLYNHIDHVAKQCEAASLNVANARFAILKERILRLNAALTGSRYLRGVNRVGGLRFEPGALEGALLEELAGIERDFTRDERLLRRTDSFLDRIVSAGPLSREDAAAHAAVGPVARGSGIDLDCRRDHPYAAYPELDFEVQTASAGDADARFDVRLREAHESFSLIRQANGRMPEGPVHAASPAPEPGAEALGWAEGARGEELYYLRFGEEGALDRVKVRTASFANWPLFAKTIDGQILTDFAFMEHSFAMSQAACDG
ncbi:MAG: NADH-quinone oxidoreductase subunit C [Rubrobacteraceae bacterium]|nr:NADH-quinone oxidoreductase subunit C [Rubrobacteraceae bacterium]